jgi:hypothetical protein
MFERAGRTFIILGFGQETSLLLMLGAAQCCLTAARRLRPATWRPSPEYVSCLAQQKRRKQFDIVLRSGRIRPPAIRSTRHVLSTGYDTRRLLFTQVIAARCSEPKSQPIFASLGLRAIVCALALRTHDKVRPRKFALTNLRVYPLCEGDSEGTRRGRHGRDKRANVDKFQLRTRPTNRSRSSF